MTVNGIAMLLLLVFMVVTFLTAWMIGASRRRRWRFRQVALDKPPQVGPRGGMRQVDYGYFMLDEVLTPDEAKRVAALLVESRRPKPSIGFPQSL